MPERSSHSWALGKNGLLSFLHRNWQRASLRPPECIRETADRRYSQGQNQPQESGASGNLPQTREHWTPQSTVGVWAGLSGPQRPDAPSPLTVHDAALSCLSSRWGLRVSHWLGEGFRETWKARGPEWWSVWSSQHSWVIHLHWLDPQPPGHRGCSFPREGEGECPGGCCS